MKEEFKDWVKAKKEENYKLENLYDEKTRKNYMREDSEFSKENSNPSKKNSSKDASTENSNEGSDKDSEQSYLEMFEYLYRVSKHIYLTPSPNEHSNNTLTLDDFEFDEKVSRYTKLPDDFIQLFENTHESKS